jgi:hypothetical protein
VREPRHPVLASPLATRMMCYLDLMHMVHCKGVASWVFGGVLFVLLKAPALGPTRKLRLDRVNADRLAWYSRHPTMLKLPRILLANCKQDDWAELAGPAFKAAITMHAARLFDHMANKYLLGDSAVYRHVRLLTTSLVAFYNCLYTAGMFLTAEEVATCSTTPSHLAPGTSACATWLPQRGHWCGLCVQMCTTCNMCQSWPRTSTLCMHSATGKRASWAPPPKCGRSQCLGPTRDMYRGWCL